MFSRLAQPVFSRAFAHNVATSAGLRPVLLTRRHLLARNFLTTAQVAEPAAKEDKTSAAKGEGRAKKPNSKKKTPTKKAKVTKKVKKTPSDDPADRLKGPLKSVKIMKEEMPPPKALSPFMFYVRAQYAGGPPISNREAFLETSKKIAEKWHQMSDAEKQVYFDQASEAKEESHRARIAWFKNVEPRVLRAINVQRKVRNLPTIRTPRNLDPTKPLPAFLQFSKEMHNSLPLPPNMNGLDEVRLRSKKIGEMWQQLPAEKKQRYIDEYRQRWAEYKKQHPEKAA